MIISCDKCNSSFSVNDSLIKDTGSKVRCSKCDSVFIAYPQSTEDIEEEELTLESDDQMPGEEDLGLDDLDSDFGDFLEDDQEEELSLNGFDDTSDAETGSKPEDALEETDGELELDLDFEQGDDLPDLDDLDDAQLTMAEAESELEDLNFELESATDAELDLEDGDKLDLADLGLEEEEEDIASLKKSSAEKDLALEVEESDALDLSDLEAALDDDSALEDTAGADPQKFSPDFDKDEQGVEEIAAADLEAAAADELDLSDLDLDIEDASVSEEATATGTEELDLDLLTESDSDSDTAAADELNLSDLSDILEDANAPAADAQADGLDFDLDLESDAPTDADEPATVADSGGIDELDLSDLEDFMKTENATAAQAAHDDSAQDLDLDLDFQMDDGAPAIETAADSQGDDELDFSDLEHMLESDETPTVDAADSLDAEELDLQFDLDEPSTVQADTAAAGDPGALAQDDDFLDIEQLLSEGEDNGLGLDDNVTDLTLEMDAGQKSASNGDDAELELDFDLESELQAKEDEDEDLFDTGDSSEYQLESNLQASDKAKLLEKDTAFQDSSATSVLSPDGFDADELTEPSRADGATYVLPGDEGDLPMGDQQIETEFLDPEPVVYESPKTRSKKPLLVVGLLFLLGIGVFIIPNMLGIKIPVISDIKIPYLSDPNFKIPYLSDWLNPAPQDVAGNLKITPLGNTIDGKFVDNDQAGQLFVIQGQIQNDYDHPRSYIKVTGKLLLKGKKIAKTATVYCGNLLTNSDLSSMDITAINKILSNRSGDKRSNLKVKTGKRVPFMIVFDKLPSNLDEYTVEVEGSSL